MPILPRPAELVEPADATAAEWWAAVLDGRIPAPGPEPAVTPAMEAEAAFRQALADVFGDQTEARGAWGGHPAGE